MFEKMNKTDSLIINFARKISVPIAHFAMFTVFFWFGILKVIGVSPAGPIVQELFEATIPFMSFHIFYVCFGIFEMIIGILFIIPRDERIAIFLLAIHMITTALPLILLPTITWQSFLVPTLEGQYIIKNLVIVALALGIAAHLKPMKK